MKINDVIELLEAEQAFGTPGSKAMGSANFALLSRFYTRPKNRTSANLTLNFGAGKLVELTTDDVEAIAKYYDTLPADADRYDFVYDTMSRADKFNALLYRLGLRQPPKPPIPTSNQTAMDLSEREVKKNSNTDLDRSSVRSPGLSTALRQAYAKYPQAQSDIEALVMHDMDVQKNTGQELQAQNKINRRQDDIDIQLRDVNRQQSKKISTLDQENDDLSAELDRLSRELDAMHAQTVAEPERKKDSGSSEKSDSTADTRSYGSGTVGSDARAEKTQRRAADAEKRRTEPEAPKLRPGSSTFKPLGSTLATVPMTKPTPAPMPTIDVIDKPSASLATTPEPVEQPFKDPAEFTPPPSLGKPETDSDVAPDAEEPNNVFQFPNRLSKPDNEPAALDQPDLFDNPPRTGTYNESQELRRMRELAGLPINEADSFYTPSEPGVFTIRVDGMFINDYWPGYRNENPEILWNGLSSAFPRDYPRATFGTANTPQAAVFARLKDRNFADVKSGLSQDMAQTLADKLGKSDPTGQFSRWIQVVQKRS